MVDRIRTLVGCDNCKRGFPYRDLTHANEYGDLCPECYKKWLDGTIDEEAENE